MAVPPLGVGLDALLGHLQGMDGARHHPETRTAKGGGQLEIQIKISVCVVDKFLLCDGQQAFRPSPRIISRLIDR